MPSGRPAAVEHWVAFLLARREGISRAEACRKAGVNYYTARDYERGRALSKNFAEAKDIVDRMGVLEVPDIDTLRGPARDAFDDVAVFALRYFGVILMPWQVEVTDYVFDLLDSAAEEYCVVNAPPGSGKSTFFAKILPAFATVRNRAIRGMIGSHTQNTAEWYTRALRNEFDREHPAKAKLNEQRLGIATDAEATLQMDYGAFKPDARELWRASMFTVLQRTKEPLSEKEPTWSAFGKDSGFLGGRFDLVIWDDLWDPRKMRTADKREDLYQWWDEVAETRLEPGGLMIVNGQRFSGDDIYRYCLDKKGHVGDDDMLVDAALDDEIENIGGADDPVSSEVEHPVGVGMVSGESPEQAKAGLPLSETLTPAGAAQYHHLKYPAHFDGLCSEDHSVEAAPWPDGCLLYPRRLPWNKLARIAAQTPDRYAVVYQQDETSAAAMLVDPLWVTGGTDTDGIDYVGCWDHDRDLWELPADLAGHPIGVASVDPSPTKFWAIQFWVIVPETDMRYLIECYRQKMDAPTLLDWDHDNSRFTGIMEDWHHRSSEMGVPIRHWIVEKNAAQRFILQYQHFKRWSAQRGVEVIAHETMRNKADPAYGVQMIAPLWRSGRVRLPGRQRTSARPHSLLLVDEVTRWNPEGTGHRTDDEVMAHWFVEHNLHLIVDDDEPPPVQWRPTWLRDEEFV